MPPPAISVLARQTISCAFKELETTITPGDARDFSNITLQHVKLDLLAIENELASRQALRNLRRLAPLFQGLEHYAKIVEVLCYGTPFLPWLWAPIPLILRVATDHLEAFDSIIQGYSRIAEYLGRFAFLTNSFSRNQDSQQTLAAFYANILDFHKHAYKSVRRNSWKQFFVTSWSLFQGQFEYIVADLQRHEILIDKEANAYNILEARQMRHEIRAWREDCTKQLQLNKEEQSIKQYNSIISWLKVDESEQHSIFRTLLEHSAKYPGTCDWVLQNQKMKLTMLRKPTFPLLWIHALAPLSCLIFCNYAYPSSTKYDFILQSLVLQLVRKDVDVAAYVYGTHVVGKKAPTIPVMERLLHLLLASISKESRQVSYVWIVLDGIDECDLLTQNKVFSFISQVTSRASSPDEIIWLSEFKILTQILVRLDSRSVDRIKCALGWIAFSKRPLKKLEFLSAIAFSSGDTDVRNIAPQYMLDICSTLIDERPDSRLGFIHVSVKELLQSSASTLILVERDCLLQHGIATVTCLLAGIKAFSNGLPESSMLVSIIKGLHGFHIYSKEYWTDYVLSLHSPDKQHHPSTSHLFNKASQLATQLNELAKQPLRPPARPERLHIRDQQEPPTLLDSRMKDMDSPMLKDVVNKCLRARSREQLELLLQQVEARGQPADYTSTSAIPPPQEGVSLVLQKYQTIIRHLLNLNDYPSVTASELDSFNRQFRSSAFTCRIKGCPRAIDGFERHSQCYEHDILHVRRLVCTYSGCLYPPFVSFRALKRHISKEHKTTPPRRSVRNAGNLPLTDSDHDMSNSRHDTDDNWKLPPLEGDSLGTKGINQPGQPEELDYNNVSESIKAHIQQFTFFGPPEYDEDKKTRFVNEVLTKYIRALLLLDSTKEKARVIETTLNGRELQGNPFVGEELQKLLDQKRDNMRIHVGAQTFVDAFRKQQDQLKAHYLMGGLDGMDMSLT
ncbi:hypothetical protein PG993_006270 [Apiospora rasikravindrae]|uniref:C2H2-type domain-containing protein n=1 Tax=Apiospora rasikravindrae TaxID=990691 RepID=A0ABR1T580_9PEZI